MNDDPKKARLDDTPYVPPMGDLSSRVGKALAKPAPRLMLTNGSAAPGASIKAAKYVKLLALAVLIIVPHYRKASATGCNPNMNEQYSHLKSIFGGRLAPQTSGFRSAIGLDGDKPEKKPEDRSVPTHWQAEQHDRAAVRNCYQNMLYTLIL